MSLGITPHHPDTNQPSTSLGSLRSQRIKILKNAIPHIDQSLIKKVLHELNQYDGNDSDTESDSLNAGNLTLSRFGYTETKSKCMVRSKVPMMKPKGLEGATIGSYRKQCIERRNDVRQMTFKRALDTVIKAEKLQQELTDLQLQTSLNAQESEMAKMRLRIATGRVNKLIKKAIVTVVDRY